MQTEPLNRPCMLTNSQSLRAGMSAVIGTSVNASWWTGQTEPDGSIPSGSSVQSTCINEDPEAKTCEYTLHVCVYICVCECLSACVPLGQPRLTSCCKLLPVDSGVFLLMTLCCMSVLSASRFNPCRILCACACTCLCLRMGTRVCCVCLLLFFPGADHFIHLSTIIKPIKRVLPYGWTSLFFHFLLQVL